MDCIFCKIVGKQIPAQVVWEDENALAFRDINPQAPVHVIFVPRRHVETFGDLEPGDAGFLASLGAGIRKVAQDEGLAEAGFRIISNNGPDGGQEVPHLHIHLVGGRPLGRMLQKGPAGP